MQIGKQSFDLTIEGPLYLICLLAKVRYCLDVYQSRRMAAENELNINTERNYFNLTLRKKM